MIEQSKGKERSQVPNSKLVQTGWHSSIKYDGNYVQIHKKGTEVKFYTSGGKEFYLPEVANELLTNNPNLNFILEAEYIGDSLGKLGNRTQAAKLTTYRTEYTKGIVSKAVQGKDVFKVFDLVDVWVPFSVRLQVLKGLNYGVFLNLVNYSGELNLSDINSDQFITSGFEGLFLKHVYTW